jgi:hypothetical protein
MGASLYNGWPKGGIGVPKIFQRNQYARNTNEFQMEIRRRNAKTSATTGNTNGMSTTRMARLQSGRALKLLAFIGSSDYFCFHTGS